MLQRVLRSLKISNSTVQRSKLSSAPHATHKRAPMEPDPWAVENVSCDKRNTWPFAIGMSVFILVVGCFVPQMLSEEQKISLNNQRAADTYAFLKEKKNDA